MSTTPWERPLMTSHVFWPFLTYISTLPQSNVPLWGLSWTPLPTLISNVIDGRSLYDIPIAKILNQLAQTVRPVPFSGPLLYEFLSNGWFHITNNNNPFTYTFLFSVSSMFGTMTWLIPFNFLQSVALKFE